MTQAPDFDLDVAHRYFAAGCFNKAWELMDKDDRTPEEDAEMLRLSLASHYHWTQRPDYDDTAASVAYWQTSRIYALLGQAQDARRSGELCLRASQGKGVGPFFLGYAYEALARAASLAGDARQAQAHVAEARRCAQAVADAGDRQALLDDLAVIKPAP